MKKIINYIKELENRKIINKVYIDEEYLDDMRFDKGLLKFWIYQECDGMYGVEVYKCEFRKFGNKIDNVIVYEKNLLDIETNDEELVLKKINELVCESDYNNSQIEFIETRINKLENDLINWEEKAKRTPIIIAKKQKNLQEFKNELIICTTFDNALN